MDDAAMLPAGSVRVVGLQGEIRLLSGRSGVIPADEARSPGEPMHGPRRWVTVSWWTVRDRS